MGKLTISVEGMEIILTSSSGKEKRTLNEETAIDYVTDWIYRGW